MSSPPPARAVSPAVAAFRKLHESDCFILPNPWDTGTALYLAHLGFKALATTSAGMAFSRGLPDSVDALGRDDMLAHIRELVVATSLPVNADFQSGFADDPLGVSENVTQCVHTGVAGLSIEDAVGNAKLYEHKLAVERIVAARDAIDKSGSGVVLTARCEAFLVGHPEPLRTAIDRLVDFAAAGADCLYAPGVRDMQSIATIIKAVAPKPINVLISAPGPELSFERLRDLGVRRISVGSALARVAWGAFIRAAESLAQSSFHELADAAAFSTLNALFHKRPKQAS